MSDVGASVGLLDSTDPADSGTASRVGWLLTATVIVTTAHAHAAYVAAGAVASAGEADLAGRAYTLARAGQDIAATAVERTVLAQLGAMTALTEDVSGGSVLAAARIACLAAGLLGCLLVWPLARRLGLDAGSAAAAVLVIGAPSAFVSLHAAVDPGALAVPWLLLAALLLTRSRATSTARHAVPGSRATTTTMATAGAAVAALAVPVALLTTPLAAVPVLAVVVAQARARGGAWPRALRHPVTALALVGMLTVVVLATGDRPWAVAGAGAVRPGVLIGAFGAGGAVAGVALAAWPRMRPAAVALLACLVAASVPGPTQTTALLLMLPSFGLLVGAGCQAAVAALRSRGSWSGVVPAMVLGVLAVIAWPGVVTAGSPEADSTLLATWVRTQTDPGVLVQADPLTRAQLLHAGVPAGRLPEVAVAAGTPVLAVVAWRPGLSPTDAARLATVERGSLPVAGLAEGPGGVAATVREVVADPAVALAQRAADRQSRARFGSRLAGNPALGFSDPAAAMLRAGDVDSRLMTVLAAMAADQRLRLTDFPAAGEVDGVPRRTAVIAEVNGEPVETHVDALRGWFGAQLPGYRPAGFEVTDGGLVLAFSAPSPVGFLE